MGKETGDTCTSIFEMLLHFMANRAVQVLENWRIRLLTLFDRRVKKKFRFEGESRD